MKSKMSAKAAAALFGFGVAGGFTGLTECRSQECRIAARAVLEEKAPTSAAGPYVGLIAAYDAGAATSASATASVITYDFRELPDL